MRLIRVAFFYNVYLSLVLCFFLVRKESYNKE